MNKRLASWTFLSNHAHVMLVLAREGNPRVRDIAEQVGITQRAVQHILLDLAEAGAIGKTRVGRRNEYELNWKFALRHSLEHTHTVAELLAPLLSTESAAS